MGVILETITTTTITSTTTTATITTSANNEVLKLYLKIFFLHYTLLWEQ